MKIAKMFKWEAAHRLPWHPGGCKNVHGHSYRMTVELEGRPGEGGMLMDFAHLKEILKPLIDDWDHATLVSESDLALLEALDKLDSKHFILPFDSTAENLCTFVANFIQRNGANALKKHRVEKIRVKIQETETCYAETECVVRSQHAEPKFAYHTT